MAGMKYMILLIINIYMNYKLLCLLDVPLINSSLSIDNVRKNIEL